jgi:hypothetical protein
MDPGGELIGPPFSLHSRLYPCPQGDNRSLVAHLANLNLIRKNFLDSVTFFLLSLRPALPSPTVSIPGGTKSDGLFSCHESRQWRIQGSPPDGATYVSTDALYSIFHAWNNKGVASWLFTCGVNY